VISNAIEAVALERVNVALSTTTSQLANGVRITDCDFEGCTDAIYCNGVSTFTQGVAGLTVIGCRAENCTSFFNYNNITSNAFTGAPLIYQNSIYRVNVTTFINNPAGLTVNTS